MTWRQLSSRGKTDGNDLTKHQNPHGRDLGERTTVGNVGIHSEPKEEKTLLTNSPNSSPSSPNIKKKKNFFFYIYLLGSADGDKNQKWGSPFFPH